MLPRLNKTVIAAMLIVAACVRHTPGPPPPTVTQTITDTVAPASPTASELPELPPESAPHSKMLPEITLPSGSSEFNGNTPDDETWHYTVPYAQAVDIIKAQFPIGQSFRGLPFCRGSDESRNTSEPLWLTPLSMWEWSNGADDFTVFVVPPRGGSGAMENQIEFRRGPTARDVPDSIWCTGRGH